MKHFAGVWTTVFVDFIDFLVHCFQEFLLDASSANLHSTFQLIAHFNHTLPASCAVHEGTPTMKTGCQLATLWSTRFLFKPLGSNAERLATELYLQCTTLFKRLALVDGQPWVMMLCELQFDSILLCNLALCRQQSVTTLKWKKILRCNLYTKGENNAHQWC